mmetsp:Transcript_26809/g.37797  ORF Transcript_26809/g.37797 Transcript_26809/m.37797 type:complete len:241 (-) Transcript_26809:906-1628(-)
MSPPKLTTDTPIPNVVKPIEPCLFMISRNDFKFSISYSVGGTLGHIVAIYIPLRCNHGFQNVTTSGTQSKTHFIGFFTLEESLLLESFFHGNTGIVSHLAFKGGTILVDGTVLRQNSNEFQIVAFSTFVIIRIMGGGDFHSTRTKFHINERGILNNGNATSIKGMDEKFSVQMLVSGIFRMDCNSGITKHCFKTCCSNNNDFIGIFNGVCKTGQGSEFVPSLGITGVALVCLDLKEGTSL